MGRLDEIKLGDIAEGAKRYKPALLTVAAIIAISAVAPGASSPISLASEDSAVSATAASAARTATPTPTPAAVGTVAPPADTTFSSFDTSPLVTSDASFDSGSSFDAGSSSASRSTPTPFESAPSTDAPATDDPGTSAPRPLTITEAGWSSSMAGTPLASFQVPQGSLPVGRRFSQDDKFTFLRLDGDETMLRLATVPEGNRGATPKVRACVITSEAWEARDGMSFSQDPTWDASQCVDGAPDGTGAWWFDLAGLGGVPANGVALVPVAAGGSDFQVAFARESA